MGSERSISVAAHIPSLCRRRASSCAKWNDAPMCHVSARHPRAPAHQLGARIGPQCPRTGRRKPGREYSRPQTTPRHRHRYWAPNRHAESSQIGKTPGCANGDIGRRRRLMEYDSDISRARQGPHRHHEPCTGSPSPLHRPSLLSRYMSCQKTARDWLLCCLLIPCSYCHSTRTVEPTQTGNVGTACERTLYPTLRTTAIIWVPASRAPGSAHTSTSHARNVAHRFGSAAI